MEHIAATLYKPINVNFDLNLAIADSSPLKIGGEIKFLREIILSNSNFFKDTQGGWILRFFENQPYQQTFKVDFLDLSTVELKDITSHLNKNKQNYRIFDNLAIAGCVISSDVGDDVIERLSLTVRGSKAIKRTDYLEGVSHGHYVDGKGLSFFSVIKEQRAHFERHVLLLALAYAYLGTMEYLGDILSTTLSEPHDIEKLKKVYIQMAEFNAKFFFHQPVLLKNASLTQTWQSIDDALRVHHTAKELLDKMTNVYHILNLDNEQKRQQKQDKINQKWMIIGLVISLLGLLELFK